MKSISCKNDSINLKFADSIRVISILQVIMVHTSHIIVDLPFIITMISKYGQMGVQLFFVASAYTLCLSTTNRYIDIRKRIFF